MSQASEVKSDSSSKNKIPKALAVTLEIIGFLLMWGLHVFFGYLLAFVAIQMSGVRPSAWGMELLIPLYWGVLVAGAGYPVLYGCMRWYSKVVSMAVVGSLMLTPLISFIASFLACSML